MSDQDLKVKVNFVCPEDRVWPELRGDTVRRIPPERLSELSGGLLNSWVLRTYYELAVREHPVKLSNHLRSDSINVVAARDFGRRDRDLVSFVLIPRGDAHRPMLANFIINQNGLRSDGRRSGSVLHWPQPGIIPRGDGRPNRISKISFKGRPLNLDKQFRSESFAANLRGLGVEFEIDAIATLTGDHTWHSYADVDAVLAVRNMTEYDASKKPASKLVNAWLAGVVPFLGPEPAFQELRRSRYDFIEVKNCEEVLSSIANLNAHAAELERYFEAATQRAAEISESNIANAWVEMLNGSVAEEFQRWNKMGRLRQSFVVASGMFLEPLSKRMDRRRVRSGRRILEV